MGFFDTLSRGWSLSKLSFGVIRKDPELLVYTLLSGIMAIIILVMMGYPLGAELEWAGQNVVDTETGDETFEPSGAYFAYVFVLYMVGSIIIVFWNSAIVASAHERFNGGDPKFTTGLKAAAGHFPTIALWGIISGTVGLLLRGLRALTADSRNPVLRSVGWILSIIAETAWWMLTFFVIPLIVIEGKGVKNSLSEGKDLFQRTWGESVAGSIGVSLIAFLIGFVCIALLVVIHLMTGLVMELVAVGALIIVVLILVFQTADVVIKAACYEFAKTGTMPTLAGGLEEQLGWSYAAPAESSVRYS